MASFTPQNRVDRWIGEVPHHPFRDATRATSGNLTQQTTGLVPTIIGNITNPYFLPIPKFITITLTGPIFHFFRATLSETRLIHVRFPLLAGLCAYCLGLRIYHLRIHHESHRNGSRASILVLHEFRVGCCILQCNRLSPRRAVKARASTKLVLATF